MKLKLLPISLVLLLVACDRTTQQSPAVAQARATQYGKADEAKPSTQRMRLNLTPLTKQQAGFEKKG